MLSPKVINKIYYEEQIDIQLYENQYCWKTNIHNFCRIKENYEQLCGRRLNTYADQTSFQRHMLRCFEQEVFNIISKHPNQKVTINDWFMKLEPPMWIVAGFECMNVPVCNANFRQNLPAESNNDKIMDKLFVKKTTSNRL